MIGDGNFISQVPLFGGLDDAQQVSLQQKMGHTTLRRGETLFDEGDLGDRLYIVTEGKVKLGHTSSDGRESLLAVLGPGEIIGELTLFDPGPRSTTATAVSPASLLYLEHEDLMHVLDTNPTLAKHMLRALAQRLRRIEFYGRHGFRRCGKFFNYAGLSFEILAKPPLSAPQQGFDVASFMKFIGAGNKFRFKITDAPLYKN